MVSLLCVKATIANRIRFAHRLDVVERDVDEVCSSSIIIPPSSPSCSSSCGVEVVLDEVVAGFVIVGGRFENSCLLGSRS